MTEPSRFGTEPVSTSWSLSALVRLLVLLAAGVLIVIGASLPWWEGSGWWEGPGAGSGPGELVVDVRGLDTTTGTVAFIAGVIVAAGALLALGSDRLRRLGGALALVSAALAVVSTAMYVSQPLGVTAPEVPVRTGFGLWLVVVSAGMALAIAADVAQVGRSFRRAPFGPLSSKVG